MNLVEPSVLQQQRQLRQFAYILAGGFITLFGLLLPWLSATALPWWPFIMGIVLISASTIKPSSLTLIYRAWMAFGAVLGWFNTRLLLSLIFFLLLSPMAIVMRLFRRDVMGRCFDQQATTYWHKASAAPKEQMEKPF